MVSIELVGLEQIRLKSGQTLPRLVQRIENLGGDVMARTLQRLPRKLPQAICFHPSEDRAMASDSLSLWIRNPERFVRYMAVGMCLSSAPPSGADEWINHAFEELLGAPELTWWILINF